MAFAFPRPTNDDERIARLLTLCPDLANDRIDDTLQGLVEVAASVCATPIALVSLVGEHEQFFRARIGLDVASTTREVSFCTWAITQDGPFVVRDALEDQRFAENPLVIDDPSIRFYAGLPLVTSDGAHALGTVCVIDREPRDIDQQQLTILRGLADSVVAIIEQQHQLGASALRAMSMLDGIADGVIATDIDAAVTYANPAAVDLLGTDRVIGHPIEDVLGITIDDRPVEPHPIIAAIREGHAVTLAQGARLRSKTGEVIEIDDSAAPSLDAHGQINGAVMVFRNVTLERQLSRELEWHGTHDHLTGLANRVAFETALTAALDAVESERAERCVLYLDLDRFKGVNDELGHAVGDQLLGQVAAALATSVRDGDLVARIGGDEFALLLADCDHATADRVARDALEAIRTVRSAFADRRATIDASVGIVALNTPNLTVEEILIRADSACYTAKHAGGGRVQLYDPALTEIESWNGSVRWMNRLQTALAINSMRLDGQLIVPLQTDERPAIEVLVRLIDGDEVIRPGAFMAAAERFRLSRTLDRWVVRNTLAWLESQPLAREAFSAVHINISGQSLGDPMLATQIRGWIERTDIAPELLCFEITESNAVAELGRSAEFLDILTSIGCRFALDDFGKGFSSFDYLRRFPVDMVKIDGSFVRDLDTDPIAGEVVSSIVSLCRLLGKTTIAEWAGSDHALTTLTELGVDGAQGHFIAAPTPLDDLFSGEGRLRSEPPQPDE